MKESNDPLLPDYLAAQRHAFQWAVQHRNRAALAGRLGAGLPPAAVELLTYLHAWAWLQFQVHPHHRTAVAAASRHPDHAHLAELLGSSPSAYALANTYLHAGLAQPAHSAWGKAARALAAAYDGDRDAALAAVLTAWRRESPRQESYPEAVRRLQRLQKAQWAAFLGESDRERLALLDALPDPTGPDAAPPPFAKLGIIPRWACPQACRHCQFIWRPPLDAAAPGPALLDAVDGLSAQLLFTGGDLTPALPLLHQAIGRLTGVATFAILLNGDAIHTPGDAHALLQGLSQSLARRPATAVPAGVVMQVSCDEFHQELLADHRGRIRERIPVARLAHLVAAAPRYPGITLALLHKQNRWNFSQELFSRGVLARLAAALTRQGHRLQLLSTTPGPRPKHDPVDPRRQAPLLQEALLAVDGRLDRPIFLASSTIDAYGRAALLDPSAYVSERLTLDPPPDARWDSDPMFWSSGPVTLFQAALYPLGDWRREGVATVLARHRKDPLLRALERFDPRLPLLYDQLTDGGLAQLRARATSPHFLYHELVVEAPLRLALTKALLLPHE